MEFKLFQIPDDVYSKTGELLILFSHVEWLIANALLLGHQKNISEYIKAKDFLVMQKYFQTLISLNFSRKLELLKEIGLNIDELKSIAEYRNTISHGLVFEDKNNNSLVVNKVSKIQNTPKDLSVKKIQAQINSLEIEGGKIIKFIEGMGYKIPGLNH